MNIHIEKMHSYEPLPSDVSCPECEDTLYYFDIASHIKDFHHDCKYDIICPFCGDPIIPNKIKYHIEDFH